MESVSLITYPFRTDTIATLVVIIQVMHNDNTCCHIFSEADQSMPMSVIVRQFHRPHGILGRLAGWVMKNRVSNLKRGDLTLEHMDIRPTDTICELGPGPGVLLSKLLTRCEQVIGIDHSELMISQSRKRNQKACEEGRLDLYHGSFADLPDIGMVDTFVAVNSLQFDALNQETLLSLRSHLKENGRFYITQQPRNTHPTPQDVERVAVRLRDALQSAGFRIDRTHKLPLQPVDGVCVVAKPS